MPSPRPSLLAALLVATVFPAAPAGDATILEIGSIDPARVEARDARVARTDRAGQATLRIETGHGQRWPGITLPIPGAPRDLSGFDGVEVELGNAGKSPVTIYCRIDNAGADGVKSCVTGSLSLDAGAAGVLRIPLGAKAPSGLAGKLFGLRGYPEGWDPRGAFDPAAVTGFIVFVAEPKEDHAFEVRRIDGGGSRPAPAVDPTRFFPFIDGFGQYVHREWPGKVRSLEDLRGRRGTEERDLETHPGPAGWDRWGGWEAGPHLDATGRFRTEKRDGKWWLVDPDGRLFFSQGIDCVAMLDITPIDGREGWFRDFPGDLEELREYLVPAAFALHGHYAGKRPRCYGFAAANLERKYGEGWRAETAGLAHRRLRSWGLNTVGNWSDRAVTALKKTPYVLTLGSAAEPAIEGSEGYWGKFPDVFDPAWQRASGERLRRGAAAIAGDPWCLGCFVDNEMSWGDERSIAAGALRSPPGQAAKKAFLEDLKGKYGTIAGLNGAWGTSHASWEALLECRDVPGAGRPAVAADLEAFTARAAARYFASVRDALREASPGTLYLGCRFAWASPVAVRAAALACDVVSFNIYRRSPADLRLPDGVDRPVIIGEFHFGALDRGMFHTGLVPVRDQEERARAYREYVEACLDHPAIVGCHWFQYQDEPTTGRVYDEENYQIGFVDGCDTPYPEIVGAARATGAKMYRHRARGR